ncbi:helix-turn-helix domain-containing protein [Candidatus Woesearchaeota archaeon]|nr:helix-turn-helix domain-containing protein [Candidatus Woesearchaeota archaeon]
MGKTILELEKRIIKADELYTSTLSEAFSTAFKQTIEDLNKREEAKTYLNQHEDIDVEGVKEEIKEIDKFINKGYESGQLLQEKKEELEKIISVAENADSIANQTIDIPIRIRRIKTADEVEIIYPHSKNIGFMQLLDEAVGNSCQQILKKGELVREVVEDYTVLKLKGSSQYKVRTLLNKAVARTGFAEANINVKFYEEEFEEKHVAQENLETETQPQQLEEIAESEPEKETHTPKNHFTVEQAAEETGYGIKKVYYMIKHGKIKPKVVKIGKRKRYFISTKTVEGLKQQNKPELEPILIEGIKAYKPKQIQEVLGHTAVAPTYKLIRMGKLESVLDEKGKINVTKKSFDKYLKAWRKRKE